MSTQSKRVRGMEDERDETTAKKNFSSLPPQLRELVLSKTDTDTRLKLFQINNEMREWVLKEELFGEDLKSMFIYEMPKAFPVSGFEYTAVYCITPRYGSQREIRLFSQYVFKVVRRCKVVTLAHMDGDDLDLTRVFPRLQSINQFCFCGTNFTGLSQMFKVNAIQVTGYCKFLEFDDNWMTNHGEGFLQLIQNNFKRCKIVDFGAYPLDKLFNHLRTPYMQKAVFNYYDVSDFERDLKMILRNGIPSLHPDSAIRMNIYHWEGPLLRIIRVITEGDGWLPVNTEAIRNKFLASYERGRVDGNRLDPIHSIDRSDVEFYGLKRKFDDERNLIFLVYVDGDDDDVDDDDKEMITQIHVKFDPIEE